MENLSEFYLLNTADKINDFFDKGDGTPYEFRFVKEIVKGIKNRQSLNITTDDCLAENINFELYELANIARSHLVNPEEITDPHILIRYAIMAKEYFV